MLRKGNKKKLRSFTKWGRLPSELNHHVMTYFEGKELFAYSQCSKLSNEQMQAHDVQCPEKYFVIFKDAENKTVSVEKNGKIDMEFSDAGDNMHKWNVEPQTRTEIVRGHIKRKYTVSDRVFQTNKNATYDGTAMVGAVRYLKRRLEKNENKSGRFDIDITCKSWPSELSPLLHNGKNCQWSIGMDEAFYASFMLEMQDCTNKLELNFKIDDFELPATFFESSLFKNIGSFECNSKASMTEKAFLESGARYLKIDSDLISDESIHKKIRSWYYGTENKKCIFSIERKQSDDKVVMGDLPFQSAHRGFTLRRNDGKLANLIFLCSSIWFTGR